MYYKITMRDKRVVFVPTQDIKLNLHQARPRKFNDFELRLACIKKVYPECKDWEMVEDDYPKELSDWEDADTKRALDAMAYEGMVSEE